MSAGDGTGQRRGEPRTVPAVSGTTPAPALRAAAGGEVASPCISVCEMSPHNGFCVGCFRTLDEIAAWSVLDTEAKRDIIGALAARRASAVEAGPPSAPGGRAGSP